MTLVVKYAGTGEPSDNLYINGLPSPSVDKAGLEAACVVMGLTVVRTKVIPDTRGQGSSAAMVQFASVEEATAAIEGLNGIEPSQIGLTVGGASGGLSVGGSSGSQGGGTLTLKYAGTGEASDNVYVAGLPSPSVYMPGFNELFSVNGFTVVRSKAIADTRGAGSSCAMVQFASVEEAGAAIDALNGQSCQECGLTAAGFPPAASSTAAAYAPPARSAKGKGKGVVVPPPSGNGKLVSPPQRPVSRIGSAAGERPLVVKYQGDGSPSDNLYLNGLPAAGITEDVLYELFSSLQCKVVRCKAVPDTRGIGSSAAMVQVASLAEAAWAIESLNGQYWSTVGGASGADSSLGLIVKYAGDGAPSSNLYITGLPSPSIEQSKLNQIFAELGLTVVRSKIIPDTKGLGSSAAMVQVGSVSEASHAISQLSDTAPAAAPAAWSSTAVPPPKRQRTDWNTPGFGASSMVATAGGTLTVKYAGADAQPSDNLYILGLPSPSVDQQALNELITGLGLTVARSKIIPDTRGTGSSAALVQVGSQEEADCAIQFLNGQTAAHLNLAGGTPSRSSVGVAGGAFAGRSMPSSVQPSIMQVKYAGTGVDACDNLYITGLPSPQADKQVLQDMFVQNGMTVLRCKVIADTRGSGSSAAMVQVSSVEEAAAAIEALSGQEYPGASGGNGNGSAGGVLTVKFAGQGGEPSDNLYITGLPSPSVDPQILTNLFNDINLSVVRSKIIADTQGRGYSGAMVQVSSVEEAQAAIDALNGQQVDYES